MDVPPISGSVAQLSQSLTISFYFLCSWWWLFDERVVLLYISWLFFNVSWLFFKDGWWFLWCSVVFDELLGSVLVYVLQLVVLVKSERDF